MALDTAADWTTQAEGWMVERLRDQSPPATAAQAKQDLQWWQIFSLFASAKLADEAVDFLTAIDQFKTGGDMGKAEDIYREFVSESAPRRVNLYDANFSALEDIFQSEVVLGSTDMFDGAYEEVLTTLDQDTYRQFQDVARKVQTELQAVGTDEGTNAETEIEIGDPTVVEMTRDRIDMAVVDNFNELALKSLAEGISENFDQLDDLVIIHAPMATDEQPYVKWIRSQPGRKTGMVTMKAKGGAFSPGSISVSGASDKEALKAAVARVSKKKVVFED